MVRARPCGERGAVWSIFCRERGKICGYANKDKRIPAQPGDAVHYVWSARAEGQLGRFTVELLSVGGAAATRAATLYAMRALPALADKAFQERDPHPDAYDALQRFFACVAERPSDVNAHLYAYFRAEAVILRDMGYGLAAERCAFDGCDRPPAYLSPKTGRAACLVCGEPYKEKAFSLSPAEFSLLKRNASHLITLSFRDAAHVAEILAFYWNSSAFEGRLENELPERVPLVRHIAEYAARTHTNEAKEESCA